MDGLLQQLHALQKAQIVRAQPDVHTSETPALHSTQAAADDGAAMLAEQLHSRPFAQIDEVSTNSPASMAGLEVCLPECALRKPMQSKTTHTRRCTKATKDRESECTRGYANRVG